MKNDLVLKRSSDCPLHLGGNDAVVYDLTRTTYYTMPRTKGMLLNEYNGKAIEYIQKVGSTEALQQFYELELVFDCPSSHAKDFPDTPLYHLEFSWLTTLQIDMDCLVNLSLDQLRMVFSLGVKHVQIWDRVGKTDTKGIGHTLSMFDNSPVESLELIVPFTDEKQIDAIGALGKTSPRLLTIFVYKAPINQIYKSKLTKLSLVVAQEGLSDIFKPKIGAPHLFTVNHQTYREAHHRNLFFNQKVAIGPEGEIKNAMTSSRVFGHFPKDDLAAIVRSDDFQTLWYARKDDIAVCCDCPYRYMCTDEREPIKGPEGWHYTSDCVYNPYTGQWADGLAPKQAL